jgi:glycosyltransferase involved in cell wall biosynthesis
MTKISISIITATYNSAATVADCLRSVASQTEHAEHIIIDGASSDGTLEIVRRLSPGARILSEPDRGIYDAMNKGIQLASGDVIGILNSDDYFLNNQVLSKVLAAFDTYQVDGVFADLVFVRPDNPDKIVRYYRGAGFSPSRFAYGCMPPHPTFFVRRKCYEEFGSFKTGYRIAADFELMARFMVKHKMSYHYLPEILVKMRTGGASTKSLKSNVILNTEILRACSENEIQTNMMRIYSKYLSKCLQLFSRP